VKFYINFATLILFLLLRLPGLKEKVDFERKGSSSRTGGGLAAFIAGVVILSTFIWAAPSHTYMGENWVLVLEMPLLLVGSLLTVGGLAAFIRSLLIGAELILPETKPAPLSGD
jgi:hypothetical protein